MRKLFVRAGSIVLAMAATASAQTPAGGEFRVNTYTTSSQWYARPAMEPGLGQPEQFEVVDQEGAQ